MNTKSHIETPRATMRQASWLISALALSVLGACASNGSDGNHISGVMQVTLKPGDTATCETTPCQVSFQMPPGSGTYEVTGNQVKIGDFPAGETVSLGGLDASNAIKVVGANVPTAYVYIPTMQ
ncbi:cupin domain-containing protein [Thiorhodovibrio frisius]|uniref:Lipoprotein n=1 Tax=Thiorhodovibrio frisius TaxID=631362 RepID=H8Z6Q4_9GAMM|nr:hypothetical protein [Thiorhodovibrio frisius]EIC20770.1 hypothetical protein Thi970DRAFT_04426 [Thiorhodovibrio frisius]WPL21518.1 hypothetical protein Thiofri_01644 [Thiorhodovibrio frisius]